MQNKSVQRFHDKITKLKNLLAHLAKTIVDKDAKEFLLHTGKNSLGGVERYLLPHGLKATNDNAEMWFRLVDFQLEVAEGELKYAEAWSPRMVRKLQRTFWQLMYRAKPEPIRPSNSSQTSLT
jgi:hypothetical protein